jgi:hypothetical protein
MNRIIEIIRERFHVIENDPENNKDGKSCDEFTRDARRKITVEKK